MCDSVFVALPKVEGSLECSIHRILSNMSQITKILLKIILKQISARLISQIFDEQFGFLALKDTNNALFLLRVLSERALEVQNYVFACCVVYEKAFDKVKHVNLFIMIKSVNLDVKDLRLMRNLSRNQKSVVRVADEESFKQEVRRALRQSCVLSPESFILYSEIIFTRDLMDLEGI